MVTPQAFYQLYEGFPPLLKQVLAHDEIAETNIALGKQFKLDPDQQKKLVHVQASMLAQEFTPAQLQLQLQTELKVDEETAKGLTREILSRIVLPMEWFLGNVRGLIHELGGNVEEALHEAKKTFPEVYAPKPVERSAESGDDSQEHALLKNFEDRVSTMKGKAEILLRLTGLSVQVEDAVKAGTLTEEEGDQMMRELDSVSYAVNTQDLNPFEVNSIKRKIRKSLRQLGQ